MDKLVVIRYARTLDAPLDQAYAWLTDYRDDDPQRTQRIVVERPVLERHPDRVLMHGTIDVLGRRLRGRIEVRLHPPDHWEAHFLDKPSMGTVYAYRLRPHARGCRLEVEYCLCIRRWSRRLRMRLLAPLLRREIRLMWDGFARSMARDLAALAPAAG